MSFVKKEKNSISVFWKNNYHNFNLRQILLFTVLVVYLESAKIHTDLKIFRAFKWLVNIAVHQQ